MKTKKAAAKRFKFTATGKVKFKQAGKRHGLSTKSSKRKLHQRAGAYMIPGDVKHVIRCMPYGSK